MTTHETDRSQELDHTDENYGVDNEGDELAREQAAEAEDAEPVAGDELDHTDPPDGDDAPELALDADADAEAEAEDADPEPGTDVEDEPSAYGDPGTGTWAASEVATDADADDEQADDAIALGPVDTETEAGDDLADEPVIVEVEETEVEVFDEPVEDTDTTEADADDDSVLLTESAPGSVLPTDEQEPEEAPFPEAEPEPSLGALLEPVGPDAPLDPGSGTYQERWSAIQGNFVDDPARTVEGAGALVEQMWEDLERSIAEQREALDAGWDTESPTDDLRAAFRSYRELFNRLATLLSTATADAQPSG